MKNHTAMLFKSRKSLYLAIAAALQLLVSTQVVAALEGGKIVGGRVSTSLIQSQVPLIDPFTSASGRRFLLQRLNSGYCFRAVFDFYMIEEII